ncbi:MAG: hypothetical protein DRP82_02845 [Planctomycetota bacterium]|nr:MAG: hypothetical protein DRP82_02845 [Planctomycetota bacterium]
MAKTQLHSTTDRNTMSQDNSTIVGAGISVFDDATSRRNVISEHILKVMHTKIFVGFLPVFVVIASSSADE